MVDKDVKWAVDLKNGRWRVKKGGGRCKQTVEGENLTKTGIRA